MKSTRREKVLVYAISPIHVVSSIAAIRTLHAGQLPEVSFLVHWPSMSTQGVQEIRDVIAAISTNFPFISNFLALSGPEKDALVSRESTAEIIADLVTRVGNGYQALYYAHDMEGGLFHLLSTAFPNAKRICFGDALGNVYERHFHAGLLQNANPEPAKSGVRERLAQPLRTIFSRFGRKGRTASQSRPHAAALILPVDQSGGFLKGVDLSICQETIVRETIDDCILSARELQGYVDDLLGKYKKEIKFVLLTDNFAEGGYLELKKEIEMYCSIVRDLCPSKSVVFLKSHPGETLHKNQVIKDELSDAFDVVELDTRFKRYPIELWKALVMNCSTICLSYPVLSLKYLYGIDVLQPMDDVFIEKWFPEWTWASYKNSLSLYMEPLKRLPEWNGRSVLWSGKYAKS
jgi:hypothetical protein